jgi:hypothetical protein
MDKTAHNLIVLRLLELGKKLDQRAVDIQLAPLFDRGETWKKTDIEDADNEVFALQAELIQMIADFAPSSDIFPVGPSGRVSALVLRIAAVVSYRAIFTEWGSVSVCDLAQAVADSDGVADQLAARRSVVSLCLQGVLRGISHGEVCQTLTVSAKLLKYLESGGTPLVIPAPKPTPRAEKEVQAAPNKNAPGKPQ